MERAGCCGDVCGLAESKGNVMRVAIDVCIGRAGADLLRWYGHDVVVEAEHGEMDRDWFMRALRAGVDLIISPDSDLEILAYDHNVKFYRPRRGHNETQAVQAVQNEIERRRL